MFGAIPDAVLRGAILSVVALGWIAVLVRVVGLRALSKMSPTDFVATLATGSLLGTMAVSSSWPGFAQAATAVTVITAVQYAYSRLRLRPALRDLTENQPMVLLRDGRFDDAAMTEARVTRADVLAKLREAGIADLSTVDAVVLETTGDISVLQQRQAGVPLDGVRDV